MTNYTVRNPRGRFMTPTSSNSRDAHIPRHGVRSRIQVKNLMAGDRVYLGQKGMSTIVGMVSAFDDFSGERMIVTYRNSDGAVFVRNFSFQDRVDVRETPRSRRERRNDSRRDYWNRYPTLLTA